jgi:hypothetical protein
MAAKHPRVIQLKWESRKPKLTISIPTKRRAPGPIPLRRQQVMTIDTTARRPSSCASCRDCINVGDRVTTVTSSSAVALAIGHLPGDIEGLIGESVVQEPTIHHPKCAQMSQTQKTRSGRISQIPVRLGDERFISGSGFAGCDHYDWSFDGNVSTYETSRTFSKTGDNLNDFVVEDGEMLAEPIELPSDEEEWESEDDTDEEDDDDKDWD